MKRLPLLFSALALGACSGRPPPPRADSPPVSTPFDAMKADEQRAKDVQKTVDEQARQQRQQTEAAQQ